MCMLKLAVLSIAYFLTCFYQPSIVLLVLLTNASLVNPRSCILYSDISDHLPVYLSTDLNIPKNRKPGYYCKRNFDDTNVQKFIDSLQQINWELYNSDYNSFHAEFTKIFDSSFPLERYYLRKKQLLANHG